MQQELKRIGPLRAANIGALIYGVVMGVFAVLLIPFMILGAIFSEGGAGEIAVMIPVMLFYPIMGLVMGWVGGGLSALIYNFIVRWTGGLLIELAGDEVEVFR